MEVISPRSLESVLAQWDRFGMTMNCVVTNQDQDILLPGRQHRSCHILYFYFSYPFIFPILYRFPIARCSRIGKKCNFKSTKTHYLLFQKWQKINFCTRKKFKITKNAIFGLKKTRIFAGSFKLFYLVQKLIFYHF